MAHEARLKADRRVTNLTLDFRSRGKGGNGVDDNNVDSAGANKHVANLECLLTGIGLRNKHLIDVDTDARGIAGVEGVLGIDKSNDSAKGLGFCQDFER